MFANLIIKVPKGCLDSVVPEPLLGKHQVVCLISDEHTEQPFSDSFCLFRVLAVHLHVTSTSKTFDDFLDKSCCDPKQFCEVSVNTRVR